MQSAKRTRNISCDISEELDQENLSLVLKSLSGNPAVLCIHVYWRLKVRELDTYGMLVKTDSSNLYSIGQDNAPHYHWRIEDDNGVILYISGDYGNIESIKFSRSGQCINAREIKTRRANETFDEVAACLLHTLGSGRWVDDLDDDQWSALLKIMRDDILKTLWQSYASKELSVNKSPIDYREWLVNNLGVGRIEDYSEIREYGPLLVRRRSAMRRVDEVRDGSDRGFVGRYNTPVTREWKIEERRKGP